MALTIGLDARWVHSGNPSGRRVVTGLLGALAGRFPDDRFVVAVKRQEALLPLPGNPGDWQVVPCAGGPQLLGLPSIDRAFRRSGVDVALFFYFAPPSAPYLRLTYVFDALFLDYPHWFTWLERQYFAFIPPLARRADAICTLTEAERGRLVGHRLALPASTFVVPAGVSPRFVPRTQQDPAQLSQLRQRLRLPERFLLTVGRINRRKNLPLLLEGIARMEDRRIPLVVVGRPDRGGIDLAAECRRLGVTERVIHLDGVIDDDLPGLYSLAEVFGYLSADEGFGLPPLEAMASGVPVVALRGGGVAEVAGDAPLWVDSESPEKVAAAFDLLCHNPALRETRIAAGLARAARYSWEHAADQLLKVLKGMIAARRGG